VGDKYQLKYWEDMSWKVMYDTIAQDKVFYFRDVPSNAFYLLSNITRGREERVFTFENGKQVWW